MSKKKVVIVGPEFGSIPQGIRNAFDGLNWEVLLFTYASPKKPFFAQRLLDRLTDPHYAKAIRNSFNSLLRTEVLPLLKDARISLLLILKGDELDPDNLEGLSKASSIIVLWTYDSLNRCSSQFSVSQVAQYRFYMDGGDTMNETSNAVWLPLGYDDGIFRAGKQKVLDVLFVGSLSKQYSKRRKFLTNFSSSYLARRFNCAFIGTTGMRLSDSLFSISLSVRWAEKWVTIRELAEYVASATICVNIHQDDGIMPVNPMFFAIPGAGTCQVTDRRSYLGRWLTPGVHFMECEEENFLDSLEALLRCPDKASLIAEMGHKAVVQQHTFRERVNTILSYTNYGTK